MHLDELMAAQDGVVSRRQLLRRGLTDDFIVQRLRRKDWARVHRGVYVAHTGPLTWTQRLWAGLLFAWPAAAADETALVLHGLRAADPAERVHLVIAEDRRVRQPEGVSVRHLTNLPAHVAPNREPPRLRLEPAVLRVASASKDESGAVAALAHACQSRRTTPARLASSLERLPRLPRRALLMNVLEDVASGAHSVLEHRYLTLVERPHALPTARRQRCVRVGRRAAYRDVEYLGGRVVVELDGRLGHDSVVDRWADLQRDVAAAVDGSVTMRLTWVIVMSPCRVAVTVGRLLVRAGWQGEVKPCGPSCLVRSGQAA